MCEDQGPTCGESVLFSLVSPGMCVVGIGLGDKCLDLLGHLNGPLTLALFFLGFFFFGVVVAVVFYFVFQGRVSL